MSTMVKADMFAIIKELSKNVMKKPAASCIKRPAGKMPGGLS